MKHSIGGNSRFKKALNRLLMIMKLFLQKAIVLMSGK